MENLYIKSYHGIIPKVLFDAKTGNCEISGESSPADVLVFFQNLNNWFDEYIERVKGPISLTLNLSYFNTSSSRGIFKILTILKKYQVAGGEVKVTWHYDEDDQDMYEEIIDQSDVAELSILIVPNLI
ncbi:MAG: DUF1987 domain-containing protein [Bacteroidota bacterium]